MDAAADHDLNVIGAAALLVTDRMRVAVEAVTGSSGASAAALTALLAWADGAHIDALAAGLRLSHSRTVRVVDGLERERHAVRRRDPIDGRRATVHLTARGRRTAERALTARADALSEALGSLSAADVRTVARIGSRVLEEGATSAAEARAQCRWCDVTACGFDQGRCPSTASHGR